MCLTQTFTAAESLVRRSGNLDALCRHRQFVRLDSHWLNTEDVTTLLSFTRHAHMYGPFHVTLTPLMEGCSGCTVSLVPLPVLVCRSTLGHTPAYTKLLRLMPVRSSLDTDLSPSVSLLPTVRSATEWRERSRGAHRANHHRFLFFPQALHGGGGGAVIVSMHTVPKVITRGTSVPNTGVTRQMTGKSSHTKSPDNGSFSSSSSLLIMALWGNLGQAPSPNRKGRALSY